MDFESSLIREVKIYTFLWNKADACYKDSRQKEAAWEIIGQLLGQPAQYCKTKWKNLRDTFVRLYHEDEIGAAGRNSTAADTTATKWRYFDALMFLRENISRRSPGTSLATVVYSDTGDVPDSKVDISRPVLEPQEPQNGLHFGDDASSPEVSSGFPAAATPPPMMVLRHQQSTKRGAKRKEPTARATATNVRDAIVHYLNNKTTTTTNGEESSYARLETEDELYGRALGITLSKYPMVIKSEVKLKIQQALFEADTKLDHQRTSGLLNKPAAIDWPARRGSVYKSRRSRGRGRMQI